MIRIARTIIETKEGTLSTWIITRKVFIFGILVYNYHMEENGYNDKKQDIGFHTGHNAPLFINDFLPTSAVLAE